MSHVLFPTEAKFTSTFNEDEMDMKSKYFFKHYVRKCKFDERLSWGLGRDFDVLTSKIKSNISTIMTNC